MPFFKKEKKLAGPGFIILNTIRVMNIIALLACVAASFSMLVKTFVVSKFFFFDGVSHLITAILSILLLITECSLFKRYIAANWPLLSPTSGFVTLGILMIVIGVSILGNLNKEATSEDSLGPAFWRITIASGIIVCIMGVINIFVSYWFRQKSLNITARQVRMYGNLAQHKVYIPPPPPSSVYSTPPLSAKPSAASYHRSIHNPARRSTLPSYHTNAKYIPQQQPIRNISAPIGTTTRNGTVMSENNNNTNGAANVRMPSQEGYAVPPPPSVPQAPAPAAYWNNEKVVDCEEGYAPIVNGVQRPDLVHHPAMQGGRF